MKKQPGWEQALQDEFFLARNRQFEWGYNDCALFCARCVERTTGSRVVSRIKKQFVWTNKSQGLKLLAKNDFRDMVSEILGPSVPANLCKAGDVMLVHNDGQEVLGMHEGHFVVGVSEYGIDKIPLENAICGWSIP